MFSCRWLTCHVLTCLHFRLRDLVSICLAYYFSLCDAWSCLNICWLRLLFSLHWHWAYPRVYCMVTFCVLCWSLFYTGAYPHLWVHKIFCRFSHYSIHFLIIVSRHIGAYPPFSVLLLGHTLFLGSSYLLLISWSFDPFADTSESFTVAYPIFIKFIIPVTSLRFFWVFLVVNHILCFLFLL